MFLTDITLRYLYKFTKHTYTSTYTAKGTYKQQHIHNFKTNKKKMLLGSAQRQTKAHKPGQAKSRIHKTHRSRLYAFGRQTQKLSFDLSGRAMFTL